MKYLKTFSIVLLSFSLTSIAQVSNNGFNRGGFGPSGQRPATFDGDEKSASEQIDDLMIKFKEALNLDALQEVAIKQILLDDSKYRGIVIKKETDEEAKSKELQALNNKVDTSILALLNPEQQEQYRLFKERKGKTKSVKKSKKKENN
jgi:hypothetical protein